MVILERFEGDVAVLETDNGSLNISRAELPEEVCDGDVLVFSGDSWSIDREKTDERRAAMRSRMRRLIKKK